ncbi:MAG: MinD/ParA family ATP-binding protein [Candidatus Bathyarchaeia archaeon]
MKKAIAVHSYKGGTGKTSIAANLAALLAMKGVNVCLLDYDFRAPSIQVLFRVKSQKTINDFLEERCSLPDVLLDISGKYLAEGHLYIGCASSTTESLREMMTKDRRWEMRALHRTLSAKNKLYDELQVDYIIFDTSPGVSYSSINALASSDFIVLVTKMDEFDMEGTKELVHGIYDTLGRKTGLLLNKIPMEQFPLGDGRRELEGHMSKIFNLPFLGVIPCYCDIQADGGRSLIAVEHPKHPFTQALSEIMAKVQDHLKGL